MIRNAFIKTRSIARGAIERLLRSIAARGTESALLFIYDLRIEPVTFDFLVRLVQAEIVRRSRGVLPHLDVLIILRDETQYGVGEHEIPVGRSGVRARIHDILVATAELLPSFRSVYVADFESARWIQTLYPQRYPDDWRPHHPVNLPFFLDRVPVDELYPLLVPSERYLELAREYLSEFRKPVITVTIREYGYLGKERNSSIENWVAFAETMSPEYQVVMIPDATNYASGIRRSERSYSIFDAACWNVKLRAALYALSYANLGTTGGPLHLSLFQETARTLMFVDYSRYPEKYLRHVSDQYHRGSFNPEDIIKTYNLPQTQRLDYGVDSYEFILSRFRDFEAVINETV